MQTTLKFFIMIGVIGLSGCSLFNRPSAIDTTNLVALESVTYSEAEAIDAKETSELRSKALEDTALSLGAQAGLAWASAEIDRRLEKDRSYLESVYNFNGMMLSHGVIPPVLEQGNNSLNLDDPTTIRIADRTYKIVEQARFATTPPHWRDYLWMSFSKPELPHKAFLPHTEDESKVWKHAIKLGWEKGIEQSYSIFQQGLARLKRDYQGMILYRKLLQGHLISPPFVAKTSLGVTGDGNVMRVNDQVLRIAELPQLQTDTSHWKAIVVKENEQ